MVDHYAMPPNNNINNNRQLNYQQDRYLPNPPGLGAARAGGVSVGIDAVPHSLYTQMSSAKQSYSNKYLSGFKISGPLQNQ